MATAELRGKITLDNSQYMKAMKASSVAAMSFSVAVGSIAAKAVEKLVEASIRLVEQFAEGVKNAYEFGHQMEIMSNKTGIAVGQMVILNRAAKDTGIEDLSMATKKMQESLVDAVNNGTGPAARALSALGIRGQDLIRKLPADQIQIIGDRISAIQNPALRASEAVALFGRTGTTMLALFEKHGALGAAAQAVGKQAQILQTNAAAFSHVATGLGHASDKLMGFFVGVAETILPAMTKLVDALDSIDLAEEGEMFGTYIEEAVEFFVGAFQNPGQFFDVAIDYLEGGVLKVAELMAKRFIRNAFDFWADFAKGAEMALAFVEAGWKYIGQVAQEVIHDAFKAGLDFFYGGWQKIAIQIGVGFLAAVSAAVELFSKGIEAVKNLDFSFDFGNAAKDAMGKVIETANAGLKFVMEEPQKKSFGQLYNESLINNPLAGVSDKIRKAGGEFADKVDFGSGKFLNAAKDGAKALQQAGQDILRPGSRGPKLEDYEWINAQFRGFGQGALTSGGLSTGGLQSYGLVSGLAAQLGMAAYNRSRLLSHRERAKFEDALVAQGVDPDIRRSSLGAHGFIRSGDHRRRRNIAIERERENQKAIASHIASIAATSAETANNTATLK